MSVCSVDLKDKALSSLLPYKFEERNLDIPKGLQEYLILLMAALNTSQALALGNYHSFDALVGENFCQCRALKVALTAKACRIAFQRKENVIHKAIQEIKEKFSNKNKHWYIKNQSTFEKIVKLNLDIAMSDEELFFIQAHLLTVIKHIENSGNYFQRKEKTRTIQLGPKLTKQFREDLVFLMRKNLATDSVNFVQELALQSKDPRAIENLSDRNIVVFDQKPTLPFFAATKAIVQKTLEQEIPLVLIVEQMINEKNRVICQTGLFYEACNLNHRGNVMELSYRMRKPHLGDLGKPVMVVQGVMCRDKGSLPNSEQAKREIEGYDVKDLIFATSAAHRQFMDSTLAIDDDEELDRYREYAEKWGCTRENARLFTTFHMHCDKLENIDCFKYIINNHLLKYHDFYRQMFFKAAQSYWNDDLCKSLYLEGSRLKSLASAHENSRLVKLMQLVEAHGFLIKTDPSFGAGNTVEFDLQIEDLHSYHSDILKIAKSFSNPTEFLLDHRIYWSFRRHDIVKFLISIPNNNENVELMNLFIEILKESAVFDTEYKRLASIGLGNALTSPQLRKQVKNFFIEFEDLFEAAVRKHAWQQLLPVVEDVDIQALFKKIAQGENLHSLKFAARSYLDKAVFEIPFFDEAVFKRISLISEIDANSNDLEKLLLWLKTITVSCPTHENLIIDENAAKLKSYIIRLCKTDQKFKNYVTSLYEANPHCIANSVEAAGAIFEAFDELSAGHIDREWEKHRVSALIDMLVNEENKFKQSWRILAIRSFVPLFFYEPELGWTDAMHRIFKERNQVHANRIYPYLERMYHDDSEDIEVKQEIKLLLNL